MVAAPLMDWQRRVRLERFDGTDLAGQVSAGLQAFGLQEALTEAERVFIKPNLVTDVPEYIAAGANTDVRIIEAVLQALHGFPGQVLLGESETGTRYKGRRLENALRHMGVLDLQERYPFEIVNLTHTSQQVVSIPGARALPRIALGEPLLGSDLIINLPKLKTHKYSIITCSLKNMFGVIPDPMRVMYHHAIHQVLADLNSLFWQRMFVVVDGLVGMEGQGPLYGTPVPLDLLLFARNPLAADIVASQIMGFEWRRVRHLRLFEKQYAPLDGAVIKVEGSPVAEVQRDFIPARKNLFVRVEEQLMRHPPVVRFLFSDFVRGRLTRHLNPLLERMRGGSYSWYFDDGPPDPRWRPGVGCPMAAAPRRPAAWRRLLPILLTASVLGLLATQVNLKDLRALSLHTGWAALGLGAYLTMQYARGWRLWTATRRSGSPLRWGAIACVQNLLLTILPFRTGELSYIALAAREPGVTVSGASKVLVAVRLLDMATVCLLFIAATLLPGAVPPAARLTLPLAMLVMLLCLGVLVWPRLLTAVVGPPLLWLCDLAWLRRWCYTAKVRTLLSQLLDVSGEGWFHHALPLLCLQSLGVWLISCVLNYACAWSLGVPLQPASALYMTALLVLSSILPIHGLAGYGPQDAIGAALLMSLGFSRSVAIPAQLAWHTEILLFSAIAGGLGWLLAFRRPPAHSAEQAEAP